MFARAYMHIYSLPRNQIKQSKYIYIYTCTFASVPVLTGVTETVAAVLLPVATVTAEALTVTGTLRVLRLDSSNLSELSSKSISVPLLIGCVSLSFLEDTIDDGPIENPIH